MSDEQQQKDQRSQALAMMKAVHEDKCAEINGREYHLTGIDHRRRRKVFAFFSHVQNDINQGDFWFLDSDDWQEVEKVIENCTMFEGDLISKRKGHWDEYPEDYMLFVSTMLGALSYPFLRGLSGD